MDGETLRAISDLICGNMEYGGNVPSPSTQGIAPAKSRVPRPYLQKWEVKELFANCGFSSREELQLLYDRSQELKESRHHFSKNCLERFCFPDGETRVVPPKFKELLLQLCAPRTYPSSPEIAELVINYVNNTLSFYNVTVSLNGGRPVLNGTDIPVAPDAIIGELPSSLNLYAGTSLSDDLKQRWAEMDACFSVEAYRATLILVGGIAEAFLRICAQRRPDKFKGATSAKGKTSDPMSWDFSLLILSAREIGVIDTARARSLESVRLLRNLVHPFSEKGIQQSVTADKHSVLASAAAARGLLSDCERFCA